MLRFIPVFALTFILSGCATGIAVKKYNPGPATKEAFKQCRGFGCSYLHETRFTPGEWQKVAAIFKKNPARNAEEERKKIGAAIALMERIIGEKTGAKADLGGASMSNKTPYQLDCIDETTNTAHYLGFLDEAGLTKFHERDNPIHRGFFINGWPHNTATIRDRKTGEQFVVDSYYTDNGKEPYILPRNVWTSGWKPPKPKQ